MGFFLPASSRAKYPAAGKAQLSVVVALGVGAGSTMATPAPTGGAASTTFGELFTDREADLPCDLPASRSHSFSFCF